MTELGLADLEAEADWLGWVLADNATLDQYPVSADDFASTKNILIAEALRDVYTRRLPANYASLRTELEKHGKLSQAGGDEYILGLTTRLGALPMSTAPRIRELAALRRTRQSLERALHECNQRRLEGALQVINDVSDRARVARQSEIVHVGDAVEHALKTYSALDDRPSVASKQIPSGIRNFDASLSLGPEEWLTIGADTNVGKSWLALCTGMERGKHGHQTGIISTEDPKLRWGTRCAAALSGISSTKIKRHDLAAVDFPKVADSVTQARALGIHLAFVLDGNIYRVLDTMRSLVLDHGCSAVIIDYAQNLEGIESHSTHDQFSRMYTMLRRALERLQIALIVLSQVRRTDKSSKRAPTRSDLKEGGNIEQKSDYVAMLRRDPKRASVILAKLEKSKDGGNGLSWEYEQQRSGLLVESEPVLDEHFQDGTPVPKDSDLYDKVASASNGKAAPKKATQAALPGAE